MSFTRRHPLLIYITLITLTLIVIGLIGFLINRLKVDDAVLGLVEVLVTIAIGLLSNVVAAGWFILLFQRHDASRMEFLATTVKNIDTTCQILYKRGIWVANKRADLNNAFYEKHYNTAHKVYILGIANKGFMRNFFPKYVENDFTLDTVKEQPLFKRLKSTPGFWVTVLFLDPDSPYARTRNLERDNSRTIQDLREIVSAWRKFEMHI